MLFSIHGFGRRRNAGDQDPRPAVRRKRAAQSTRVRRSSSRVARLPAVSTCPVQRVMTNRCIASSMTRDSRGGPRGSAVVHHGRHPMGATPWVPPCPGRRSWARPRSGPAAMASVQRPGTAVRDRTGPRPRYAATAGLRRIDTGRIVPAESSRANHRCISRKKPYIR